jgi:predicted GH43/DUF377 family glycosyl hydrolase
VYHGVSDLSGPGKAEHKLCYSAGVMVLKQDHPQIIRYRSMDPVLTPSLPQECHGTARLDLREVLPSEGFADPPDGKA